MGKTGGSILKLSQSESSFHQLLGIPITTLGLSSRANNCLTSAGIFTASQLSNATRDSLLSIKNLGPGTAQEILSKLDALRRKFDIKEVNNLPDIPIDCLHLSVRANNCLKEAAISSVAMLADATIDSLLSIKNMGIKTAQEILDKLEVFQKQYAESPQSLDKGADDSIESLHLSVRANNCLKKAGIDSISALSGITMEKLLSIQNMGVRTAQEVLDKLDVRQKEGTGQLSDSIAEDTESAVDSMEQIYALAKSFSDLIDVSYGDVLRLLVIYHKDSPNADITELSCLLYEKDSVQQAAHRKILYLMEKRDDWVSCQTLLRNLPIGTASETLDCFLADLERCGQAERLDDSVKRHYPTAVEFAERLPNSHTRDMLLSRLHGETLEEAGRPYNLCRERVRQCIKKVLDRRPKLYEDRYQYLFEHYDFSRKDFHLAFDEPDEVYNYLEMLRSYNKSRLPVQEMLSDENIPAVYRRKAEKAIYRKYVTIDGVRVKKCRPDLIYYTVRNYCRELTSIEDFLGWYQLVLESVGLENEPSLAIISARSYENKLNRSNYVLWNLRHNFRYYLISEKEYEPFLEALNLEQYENQEISSLKLFRDNPRLMEEYDIRDEYELHNLLKKIWQNDNGLLIHFKKMPIIKIGTADRDRQVLDLLVQYAPVSNAELAQRYEESYGAKSASAMSSYFTCIEQYFHDGVYQIDLPSLPEEQQRHIAALLTDNFYRMADVRRIYQREFPDADQSNINPLTIKNLGFHPYSDYIVSNRFSNISNYIHHLLTDGGVIDMRNQVWKLSFLSIYWSELAKLKSQREIVEFAPKQYITIQRLNAGGVTVADMDDYCATVYAKVRPNTYFTITSLRQDGFSHPLDNLGFDDWFYGSLLAEDSNRFSCRRMGGTRVFRKGHGAVQLVDLLHWIVEAETRIDVYDLLGLLEQRYGVVLPFYTLTTVINGSDLYYDTIMKAVYIDYDTYFEEV